MVWRERDAWSCRQSLPSPWQPSFQLVSWRELALNRDLTLTSPNRCSCPPTEVSRADGWGGMQQAELLLHPLHTGPALTSPSDHLLTLSRARHCLASCRLIFLAPGHQQLQAGLSLCLLPALRQTKVWLCWGARPWGPQYFDWVETEPLLDLSCRPLGQTAPKGSSDFCASARSADALGSGGQLKIPQSQ